MNMRSLSRRLLDVAFVASIVAAVLPAADARAASVDASAPAVVAARKLVPADVRSKGTLVAAMPLDYEPYNFLDDKNEQMGLDVDLFHSIAEVLGLKPEIQRMGFASVIPSVTGGRVDVGMSAMSILKPRLKVVSFVRYSHANQGLVVSKGNPAGVTGLADFTKADLKLALCDESAPCGTAAKSVFDKAGLTAAPDTYGQDVKATLALVTGGEVDAAMVYKTDAIAAGDAVETITFPEAASVINDYPIATTKDTENPDAAQAFVDLVLSADGQKVLTDAGFDPAS